VQLALAVKHTWEVAVETVAESAALAVQRHPTGTRDATALSKGATAPGHGSHDSLLCPVCRLLSQAKNGMAPHRSGVFLLQISFALPLSSACHSADLDLASSAPRAPPCFL
jgi:hypothetical protein